MKMVGSGRWQLAFVERLRTIQIVSRERHVRIDALRLARRRFSQVRIAAATPFGHSLPRSRRISDQGWCWSRSQHRPYQSPGCGRRQGKELRGSFAALSRHTRGARPCRIRRRAGAAQRSRKDRTARFDRPESPMQIEALVGRYLAEPTRSRMAETIPSCKKSAGSLWSSSIATRCGWRRRFITRGSRSRCTAFSMM